MRTFMLGWEFPPMISGGLGTACYGLTKAMDKLGIKVTFVLPKGATGTKSGNVSFLSTQGFHTLYPQFSNVRFRPIASQLKPYDDPKVAVMKSTKQIFVVPLENSITDNYSGDIFSSVRDYSVKASEIAATETFDVIHAHDWMTYPAGEAISRQSKKPLIVHVHSTEFDRSGEHVNQSVYDIERMGIHSAAKVITVSNYTKNTITHHYDVAPERIEVVYNAVEPNIDETPYVPLNKKDKIVLFLGRITMQKGPDYFLAAAKKIIEAIDKVKFVIAGTGDMMHKIVEMAAMMGIGNKVLFTGFLNGADVDRAYKMADLYVMPSVSEPFGIASLEAMRRNVPVLISNQSGVAELVTHALKVDFWDINEMANKMIAVLKRPSLQNVLRTNGFHEASKFTWEDSAKKVNKIYEEVTATTNIKEG